MQKQILKNRGKKLRSAIRENDRRYDKVLILSEIGEYGIDFGSVQATGKTGTEVIDEWVEKQIEGFDE